MEKFLQEEFGFKEVKIIKFDGYENANYLVKTDGKKYILKTYKYDDKLLDFIKAENEILLLLQKSNNNKYPKPVELSNNSCIKICTINNERRICRMLTFLEGTLLGDAKPTKELFQSYGAFLAKLDLKLQKLTNYTIDSRQGEWDFKYLDSNKKYINDIPDAKDRNLVSYFFQQFEENVKLVLPKLRKQIIHHDANECNVLVENGKISGIIDFGDLSYSQLISELAIAIAYACYDKENPLEWASIILKSYHGKLPIEETEIKILYYLIAVRLVISVCNSAHSKKTYSENTYLFVSEKSAWKMLYSLQSINPLEAEDIFRNAIGLPITNELPNKSTPVLH
jgi:Ser/Thr protein kinase RdoA (MazF antagonist)